MKLLELLIKIKDINKKEITSIFSTDALFRYISFYITPIFYYLKLSPNSITLISLMTGVYGSLLIISYGQEYLQIGIILFFLSIIIDYCDGNIARILNIPTFYGRFLDGFIDTIVLGSLQIALIIILMNANQSYIDILGLSFDDNLIFIILLISLFSTPIQHFIYDRYSSYIRWIKEEHNKKLSPTIKTEISFTFINLLNDLQILFIILCAFSNTFIFIYFLINLFSTLLIVSYHMYFSKKNMNLFAETHRIKNE